MRKTIISVTIFVLIFIVGVYFITNYSVPKENPVVPPATESVLSTEEEAKPQSSTAQSEFKVYKVKNYNGNVAVFSSESYDPISVTSVAVEELPPVDQELLKKGIEVSSEEELITLLEDYCS